MTASPLHPIVIWFGRVGDMILLSALLDVLAARYGGGCHVIGAGSWPGEACSHWVDRLVGLGRLTPPAFDAAAYPWPCPAPPGAPRLEVSAAAQADCDAWLEDKGWRERPLVLVQPGNRRTMRGRRLRL